MAAAAAGKNREGGGKAGKAAEVKLEVGAGKGEGGAECLCESERDAGPSANPVLGRLSRRHYEAGNTERREEI